MEAGMDLDALRSILTDAFPELSGSEFIIHTAGWDCVAVDVDDRLIFKFPRHELAEKALTVEARLLTAIRPAVSMPVPDLTLFSGPPRFSRHVKLKGEHLPTQQYLGLSSEARQRLASDMALFYAELHSIDGQRMEALGAGPLRPWLHPDDILRRVWPILPSAARRYADKAIDDWQQLPPDPYGVTYGFFDGHGWNMAFDYRESCLNGIYDFADSGFGPLHQEFIYSNWIEPDLTARIVVEYEALTGRDLDRQRIHLLSGVLRLSELAEAVDDAVHFNEKMKAVRDWISR